MNEVDNEYCCEDGCDYTVEYADPNYVRTKCVHCGSVKEVGGQFIREDTISPLIGKIAGIVVGIILGILLVICLTATVV